MLAHLTIKNVAVIENAQIDFSKGLNILTGETGAGKSIVIDSINAILGERTSKDIIRTGTDKAFVFAEFTDVSKEAKAVLVELGIDDEDELIIQRTLSSDGKSSCRINSQPVTASALKLIGNELITVCGQHDSQKLLQKSSHLYYIDSLAGDDELLSSYRETFNRLTAAENELSSLSVDETEKRMKLDFLQYQIQEIEDAAIEPGEQEKLINQKRVINNRENIIKGLHTVETLINGDESVPGINDLLYNLNSQLTLLAEYDVKYSAYLEKAESLRYELEECASDASSDILSFDFEGASLDQIESRLDVIYRMSKKYGGSEESILSTFEKLKEEYDSIRFSDERIKELTEAITVLKEEALQKAVKLSQARKKAAQRFEQDVIEELSYLNMPQAVFSVRFSETELTSNGIDSAEFFISINPGQEPKPLIKTASGGELSRIMLAIRCCLSEADGIGTMIFDEIDSGVSGSAAGKIAVKLRDLSRSRQVICVTHLPQIAASADNHLYIQKEIRNQQTLTDVYSLDHESRVREIAKIISGDNITDSVLRSAEEMIKIHSKTERN